MTTKTIWTIATLATVLAISSGVAVYAQDKYRFMVKDSKRFADSGAWGYGMFKYDGTSDTYTPATLTHTPPQGNDAKCGFACHAIVKGKDYVFTVYAKR